MSDICLQFYFFILQMLLRLHCTVFIVFTWSCTDRKFDSSSLFSFSTFCFSSYSSSSWTSICFSYTNTHTHSDALVVMQLFKNLLHSHHINILFSHASFYWLAIVNKSWFGSICSLRKRGHCKSIQSETGIIMPCHWTVWVCQQWESCAMAFSY